MWPMHGHGTYFLYYVLLIWLDKPYSIYAQTLFGLLLLQLVSVVLLLKKAFNVVILPVFGFLTSLQELIWQVQFESRILLDFTPNDKHFPHMKQCDTAEMDWSPEIFISSEKSLFSLISLYLGILVAVLAIWQNSVENPLTDQAQSNHNLYHRYIKFLLVVPLHNLFQLPYTCDK